jgi:hypothetical protein
MDNNQKEHFWIPDEEVIRIEKTITSRPKPRNIKYSEHGAKLSSSLQSIKDTLSKVSADDSLSDFDLMVFKIELPEDQKIKDKKDLFDSTGLNVKAVKDQNNAIVTTSISRFQNLKHRIEKYTESGTGKSYFDYIEDFKPYIGNEKDSRGLQKTKSSDEAPNEVDVQLMLLPNLDTDVYENVLKKILAKISSQSHKLMSEPYYLSDKTPIIRAVISTSSLFHFENDPAIYRIEETDFFSADSSLSSDLDLTNLEIDENVVIENLPIVTILDSGVKFPTNLQPLIVDSWNEDGLTGNCEHGTKVASRVSFKYISDYIAQNKVVPRARIIDCNIIDNEVSIDTFLKRIQEAVLNFNDISKIFNLSANTKKTIEGDEMSILGYELDMLHLKYNVQFIVSAGNHNLWNVEEDLGDIIDDDDSRIASPADSMMSIVVGATSGASHPHSLSQKNQIASYSRRGPGFNGFNKPDLTAFGGSITKVLDCVSVPSDKYSLLLDCHGKLSPDAGTSFTAPVVAGDYAEILNAVPNKDILIAKALLYHNAKPMWDEEDIDDDELALARSLYGRGLSNVNDSIHSTPSKVTFVRKGVLNRTTKERVKVYMPDILAAQVGRNIARVSVTCVTMPTVDRTKGTEYLGAYIRASLKKSSDNPNILRGVQPKSRVDRQKWDTIHQFTKLFSKFNSGDWQIWLEMFSRWDAVDQDVSYALIVTIEDVSNKLDIYSEIEALNRYRGMNKLRLRAGESF